MDLDFRKPSRETTIPPTQAVRAKVLDSEELEVQANRFLGNLYVKFPNAEIINVTQCGHGAVLMIYRVPAQAPRKSA